MVESHKGNTDEPDGMSNNPLLAAAFERGRKGIERLLLREGGVVSVKEAAERLGVNVEDLAQQTTSGSVIGFPTGDIRHILGEYSSRDQHVYPGWQFNPEGVGLLPGLEQVLAACTIEDPFSRASFVLGRDRGQKTTNLTRIRKGQIEPVVIAARAWGEHGAS